MVHEGQFDIIYTKGYLEVQSTASKVRDKCTRTESRNDTGGEDDNHPAVILPQNDSSPCANHVADDGLLGGDVSLYRSTTRDNGVTETCIYSRDSSNDPRHDVNFVDRPADGN